MHAAALEREGWIEMLMTIERLREISAQCLSGGTLDAGHARWLGERLADFLACRHRSIEEAFGLRFAQGGIPWWKEERIRRRDACLRSLAATYPGDMPLGAMVRDIHKISVRYGASAWRFERRRAEMPAAHAGTARAYLWQAFKTGAPMPLGERQLRNILAGVQPERANP